MDFTIGSTPSYLFDDITLRAKLPNGQVCFEKTVTVVRTDFAGTLYARVDQDPAIFCPPDVTNTPLVGPESRIDKLLDLYNGANNALKTVEPEDEDAAEIVADTKWVKKPAGGGAFQMCLEVTPGSKPGKVRLEVRDGNDRLIHKGDIVVVKVDLNIARLNGETVSQGIEHSEGSIAKVYVPGLDSTPNGSQVKIPTMRVDPPLTASGLTFTLKKVGPSSNVAGKVEVWRGNTIFLHDNEPETDVDRSLLTLPPSTPAWRVRCTATGVVDLALIVKKGGVELCRDQVRIICTPVPPKNGKILLVNDNNELDLPELGFEAFDTIASALWAAPSNANANIAIARGTYNEHHLIVPQTVIIVGLGGGFETTGPDERIEFNFANLPIVNGNVGGIRDVVFIMNGGLQRMVAALKITKGKSQAGGGVQILFSSQDEVRFCEITDNIAGPNGYGGGIYVANSDRVFITKNRIKGNEAQIGGGGVFITDSISTISHNRISVNDAGVAVPVGVLPTQSGYGGGIGIQGSNGNVNMVKNIINLNYASTVGGGIGIVGLHDNLESLIGVGVIGGIPTTIEDNVIAFNEALAYGRGATQSTTKERGGGIYNGSNSSVLTLEGNTIIWNTSGGDGGGITTFVEATTNGKNNDIKHNTAYDDGGGIDHGTQSEGYWEDNRIAHNKAVNEHGGGLHASVRSSVVIKRNSFHENRANLQGGGLYLRNSYLTSQGGNTIEANVASEHGGGIFILAETDAPHLLTLGNPTLTLTANDKVLSNTAVGHGGGVSVEDTSNLVDSTINIQHTLFDGNRANGTVAGFRTAGLYLSNNDDFTVNNNRFQNHNGAAFTGVDLESNPLTTGRVEIISNSFNRNRCGMNLKSSPVIVKANLFRGNTFCHINLTDVKFLWVFSNRFTRNPITKFGIIVDKSNYESGELEIHRNSFIGHNLANASHAIFVVVTPAGSFIDAKNNWWNSVGGPHDPPPPVGFDGNYNNNPPGDRVTDGVDYKPFLNSSP